MRKQILIVDSDKRQIKRISIILRKAVRKWGGEAEVYIATTISEADCLIRQKTMDLLVVDTVYKDSLPGEYTGVEWVKKVRGMKKYVFLPVVFVASLMEPEKYAYMELNCLGFLPRAFDSAQLLRVFEKSMYYRTYRDEENYIFFRKKGVLYPVKVKDIVYVETINRILHVYQKNKQILKIPHKPMTDILLESKADCLMQCSKNMLVNKEYVIEVNLKEDYLRLDDEERNLSIGKKYVADVNDMIASRERFRIVMK